VAPDGAVRLRLSGPVNVAAPASVRAKLTNATRAGNDRVATLERGADGIYAGRMAPVPPGRWLVSIETDAWRLPTVEAGGALQEVRLGTARAVD
jgi:hypothetical protein